LKENCKDGKFRTTEHSTIMEYLRQQADRFRKEGRLQEEDMETIIEEMKEIIQAADIKEEEKETTKADEHQKVMEAVNKGLMQVHGSAPNSKQDGVVWIMCKNANGLNNGISGNNKIAKALDIKDKLDIDCLMYCKHRLHLRHKNNKNDFKQMFQREIACTAVVVHNIHESKHAGRVQEGGTGAISVGDATGYIRKVGKDEEGLGRWSWILFGGSNDHKTRLITAYNPCKNKIVHSRMSYQQQWRYFVTKKKDLTCPLIMFCQQLIKQLKKWRAEGDRIVLFMDHNEHVYDGAPGKALSNSTGLNLQEVILQHTDTRTGATFFRGSKPINGLWASSNLEISNTCVMPFGYGVGDHQAFILGIMLESQVGKNLTKIVWPVSRKLNSRLPQCG
jgi:hypothetical protein